MSDQTLLGNKYIPVSKIKKRTIIHMFLVDRSNCSICIWMPMGKMLFSQISNLFQGHKEK